MLKTLIGLDIGTTTVKAVLMDERGNVLSTSSKEYVLESNGEWCEIEVEQYWLNSVEVIKEILKSTGNKAGDLKAISFSCQGETLICLDRHGTPVRKAIVWLDNRSFKEAQQIWDHFGKERINKMTGQIEVLPFWTANRILWLKKNEPKVFKKINKFLLVEDYIIYRLTGKYATEQSLLSSTLYFDIYKKKWWDEMLSFLGITQNQLPTIYKSGTQISFISSATAKKTGLPEQLNIVAGAFDHVAGAIGAGNICAGMISETTGTSMAMVVTLDQPINNIPIKLPVQCHAIEGKYLLLPYAQTAGMMLRWLRDALFKMETIEAIDMGGGDVYDVMTGAAALIPPGSEGLIALPHLMGSGSPEFNVNAKGAFVGIQIGMGKGHFTRAVLESIAFIIKRNIEILEAEGVKVNEIRALGGGAKSILWNQIKSDVINKPIFTLYGGETTSIGAAILAGVGCHIFKDIEDGCRRVVRIDKRFFPIPENQSEYETHYRRYKKLSDSLESFW